MGTSGYRATVVIATRNRRDDLRVAVQSAVQQSASPEVLVVDDGSTDGTTEMIRREFPQVTLHHQEDSQGYIVQRNRAAELATGEIIISIDDDAAFSTPSVVEQTLAEFDHPRVGAVAIPFINVNKENIVMQRAPVDTGIIVQHDFIGTAHALRRDLFLHLGGYRASLFHQGEERDYCIRMLNRGYVVRMGRADPILHFESHRRDFRRMDLFGRRNDILFVWHNTPWPYFPVHLLGITALGLKFGIKIGRPFRMVHGVALGYRDILSEFSTRRPVSTKVFRLFRTLRRKPAPLEEIQDQLPEA